METVDSEWRLETVSGDRQWRPSVETVSGDRQWRPSVETVSGDWRQ